MTNRRRTVRFGRFPGLKIETWGTQLTVCLGFAIAKTANSQRVRVLELGRKQRLREVLEADGAREAVDGLRADGGEARVAGGRVWAAVDHGVGDLNAGGESIDDDAACFLLENLDELAVEGEVVLIAEYCCGEVAVKRARGAEIVGCGFAVDEKRVRTKYLFRKLRLREELVEADGEKLGVGGEAAGGFKGDGGCCKGNVMGAIGSGAAVGLRNARGEEREWLGPFDERAKLLQERRTLGCIRHENDAGFGAELAGAEREGTEEVFGELGGAFAQRAWEHEDRVAAGHLSEAGYGLRARSAMVHEGPAAVERARESDGADKGMLDERGSDFGAGTEERCKGTRVQAFGGDGLQR